ncbi:Dps family protein [Parasediminibacterium sp. JCM 36343]|uniref:Dps family protein n=1 Tax=Parasediminibacterium sp. JCM 36343 TaxID=3374279 RepID=UPI00397A845C
MKIDIGIPEKNAQAVAFELNKVLADEVLLAAKTRNYHWNVEGPSFMELHKFYEGLYDELDEVIDEVAERVRAIGHYAEGRLVDVLKLTSLLENEYTNDSKKQLADLLSDHETMIRTLRKLITVFADDYKDLGNSDFVTGLMEKHEKTAWFIRSYLK